MNIRLSATQLLAIDYSVISLIRSTSQASIWRAIGRHGDQIMFNATGFQIQLANGRIKTLHRLAIK